MSIEELLISWNEDRDELNKLIEKGKSDPEMRIIGLLGNILINTTVMVGLLTEIYKKTK